MLAAAMQSIGKSTLTAVIPTFNAQGNMAELAGRPGQTFNHPDREVVRVDRPASTAGFATDLRAGVAAFEASNLGRAGRGYFE
ncbi:MAG TPA: hypothetical protein VIA80_15850 [Hyphomonadaceae bacterium]|jgi:hypothetical protein